MGVVDDITAGQFRGYFTRDFNYLPDYSESRVYFKNDIVFYEENFYRLLVDSAQDISPDPATDPPTWEAAQVEQSRYVLDSDIGKALRQAGANTNPGIFESDEVLTDAFLYCAAHFMVMDIRMAESGLDSRGEGALSSKSVGSVSVSFTLPEAFSADAVWNQFTQTGYGIKYLSYVIPRVTGRPGIARGATLP